METLVQENLGIYYALFVIFVAFSALLNVKESKRIYQTKIAKYYTIVTIILFIVTTVYYSLELILEGLAGKNYQEPMVLLFIDCLFLISKLLYRIVVVEYPIIILVLLVVGLMTKFDLKIKDTKDILLIKKLKDNFISKKFFDKDKKINDTGIVIRKVTQNLSYTLMILYLCMPIFWHYEIKLFMASFINLFLVLAFFEFYSSLNCGFILEEEPETLEGESGNKKIATNTALRELLKFSITEVLENSNKMVLNQNNIIDDTTSLICEISNWEQFRDVNMDVMNSAFFENKKVLVICSSMYEANKYYKNLVKLNYEYDGKIAIKLLTSGDKLFDNAIDIYIATLELFFGNIKLLSKLDTIIIEDIDKLMQKKLELLRAFGSIVKMGNPSVRYVLITYMKQGIEAAIKNLLLIDKISVYNTEIKQQPSEISLNVWNNKNVAIGDIILGKINHNLGNMIPLALLSVDKETDRAIIVSQNEPLELQLNELNSIKNLADKKFMNDEIEKINETLFLTRRLKYFEYKNNNYIVVDDNECNLYDTIYKLSLINGKKNCINILSRQYLLRDYMLANYEENKNRLKHFLPYIPYEVENSKVILYNLILQLTNYGISESILLRIFSQNSIDVIIKSNSIRAISQALNKYISREFNIEIDTYSYVIQKETKDKLVFDITEKSFDADEKIYILDRAILKVLPNELFKEITFTKDGFILDIEKEYSYNFYQKYLPGQKHCLNNCIYEIKEVIDTNHELNAIVETSTDYKNNLYRQVREINNLGQMQVEESVAHQYQDIIVNYSHGKMSYDVTTLGYYEFNNGVILAPNEYRYVKLSDKNVSKFKRSYTASNVLKIEYSKVLNDNTDTNLLFISENKDELAKNLSFILTETLFTMLGENANYIQVKAVVSNQFDKSNSNWVYPIVSSGDNSNIEIYIFEDVELERGLINMIYQNLDNIFDIMHDYLEWVFNSEAKHQRNIFQKEYLTTFAKNPNDVAKFLYVKKLLNETKFVDG